MLACTMATSLALNFREFSVVSMESAYSQSQTMAQSPFFYYNPDPKPDNRQHGHFSQHPNVQGSVHYQPVPSTPIYSRPTSSCSQVPMPVQVFNSTFPSSMT